MNELLPEEQASIQNYIPGENRVSIIADTERGQMAVRRVATSLRARIMFDGTVNAAAERMSEAYPLGETVLVDVEQDNGLQLTSCLDRLSFLQQRTQSVVLVNSAPECLDTVFGTLGATGATIMSQATESDWLASMALRGDGRMVFREVATDDSLRLQRLADEVDRIARTLSDLAGNTPLPSRGVGDGMIGFRAEPTAYRPHLDTLTAADVRGMIRLRRLRDRYFRGDLFADPAWDILLDLMAARLDRLRVAVSSLCIAAAVPPTTALRWIRTMTNNGMLVRILDPEDGRRVHIELADATATAMTTYIAATKAQGGLAV